MGLLLYKSDEMYSSTELIRKSKMIFDKVLDKEIDKAIILRDGKPCFLLMEFKKYEKIMAEYEELKNYVESTKENAPKKRIKKTKPPKEDIHTPQQIEKESSVSIEKEPILVPPIQKISPEDKTKIEQIAKKEPPISEEQEIKDALQNLESMNFDEDMKKAAEEKIKSRIIQAREERAKLLDNEDHNKEDLKEELILQSQLKEVKLKKDRELREFWD